MDDREFLLKVKEYIEDSETTIEEDRGSGRSTETLISAGRMPELYREVLRRLAALL